METCLTAEVGQNRSIEVHKTRLTILSPNEDLFHELCYVFRRNRLDFIYDLLLVCMISD